TPAAFTVPALFVLLWSTGFIGARLGLPHAEPLTFLTLRYLAVIALMLPLALVLRAPWPTAITEVRHIAIAGLLMQGAYLGGVFCAVHTGMSAGVVALIVGMQPLLTAAVAGRLLGERVTRLQWCGLALGLAGVTLVVWQKMSLHGLSAGSLLLGLGALAGITLGTLYQKRYCPAFDLRTGSVIQFAAALAVTLPLAFSIETMQVQWTGEFLFALGWLVLVLSVGATTMLFRLIRRGAATRVTSLFYLTPAVTAVMAWLMFGETLSMMAICGMVIAVTGVALANRET
ncbi:MAG: DMT family transporter, partial [Arenimonas sp.]|uniref:DMT family transporter n=1 Tax=Arenimonas sp. TaxID=1872635 RepID=UPI003BFFA1E3